MNSEPHPVKPKTLRETAAEWDRIAAVRSDQIRSGKDLSFCHVLQPATLSLLANCELGRVLDVGCGTGDLTKEIAERSESVVAVDLSKRNIEEARRACAGTRNVEFFAGAIEHLEREWGLFSEPPEREFETAVAAMVLMTTPDLDALISSVSRLLKSGGCLVATLTHPCFWPRYWHYEDCSWFDYSKETFVEAPFHITHNSTSCVTTHVHRPLEQYAETLNRHGLSVERIAEPLPSPQVQEQYGESWDYPRFLAFRCRKQNVR